MHNHNALGDRGLAGLAGGCPKGQEVGLTELGLEACRLGCLCAKPLSAILQDWTSLQQLTLAWNDLQACLHHHYTPTMTFMSGTANCNMLLCA